MLEKLLEKLKDKYVFFDVDGTLSEYRFKDKLYEGKCPEFGCQSLSDLLFGEEFLNARPLKSMQNIIEKLNSDRIFVLGAFVTNHEINQKYIWLNKFYPNIKKSNMFFIGETSLKPEVIMEYIKQYKISLDEVVFVDDRLDVLRKAETFGITAYHTSSFVD